MKLENFEICSSIELQTGKLIWDLHNVACFCGLELISAENAAIMKWKLPFWTNPLGTSESKPSGMTLHFKGLQFLQVGTRDRDLPLTEDTCVSYVLKVDPSVEHADPYMRTRRDWKSEDSFRLVFAFQSGRVLEIESETVELVALS